MKIKIIFTVSVYFTLFASSKCNNLLISCQPYYINTYERTPMSHSDLNDLKNRLLIAENKNQELEQKLAESLAQQNRLQQKLNSYVDSQSEELSENYGISQLKSPQRHPANKPDTSFTVLQERAKKYFNDSNTSDVCQFLEDFCRECDKHVEEEKEKMKDLQEQRLGLEYTKNLGQASRWIKVFAHSHVVLIEIPHKYLGALHPAYCLGTVVYKDKVITAYHCVEGMGKYANVCFADGISERVTKSVVIKPQRYLIDNEGNPKYMDICIIELKSR